MPSRLVVVGGFLGAGKTTTVLAAARLLHASGSRVACVTNDQASALVDSATLRDAGFEVSEVAGGCFCCRLSDLVATIDHLLARDPDVILCEAVGSCTDIVATVILPLRRFYDGLLDVRPLSVVVDAETAREWLADGGDLQYVWREQIAEAGIILLNKSDCVHATALEKTSRALQSMNAASSVLPTIAPQSQGIDLWLEALQVDREARPLGDLDYDRYAAGEARLGWVDASFALAGEHDLMNVAQGIVTRLQSALPPELPPFHLKVRVSSAGAYAGAQLTRAAGAPQLTGQPHRTTASTLVVNARVAMPAEELRDAILDSVAAAGVVATPAGSSAFHPSYPVPQLRIATADEGQP
ncbi:MAG TPA: GTP-binding protein [Thermoanaerobaculia bacterium]|jgi:G3E family GTPase